MMTQDEEWDDLLIDEMSDHFDRSSCDVEERIKNQISLLSQVGGQRCVVCSVE
ncbi:hypothetical protein GBA52_020471 [Prunus armeniaca]|nr:hypothetical protein GBA52_020471 [Prunus armeniaca]